MKTFRQIFTKWYLQKLEFVLENETHERLWDFETQTGHPISFRRPDLALINNSNKNKNRTTR